MCSSTDADKFRDRRPKRRGRPEGDILGFPMVQEEFAQRRRGAVSVQGFCQRDQHQSAGVRRHLEERPWKQFRPSRQCASPDHRHRREFGDEGRIRHLWKQQKDSGRANGSGLRAESRTRGNRDGSVCDVSVGRKRSCSARVVRDERKVGAYCAASCLPRSVFPTIGR